MITNNTLLLIIIIIIIGFIVYALHNYNNNNNTNIDTMDNINMSKPENKKSNKLDSKKHVRFSNDIDYNIYSDDSFTTEKSTEINKLFGSSNDNNLKLENLWEINSDDKKETTKINLDDIDLDDIYKDDNKEKDNKTSIEKKCVKNIIKPSNTEEPEQTWYNSFFTPLMDEEEKAKYYAKLMQNYKNYEKSFGEFINYQTDNDTLIITDTTIDRFKAEKINNKGKGKAIKDIYDELVAPPKAKPKEML